MFYDSDGTDGEWTAPVSAGNPAPPSSRALWIGDSAADRHDDHPDEGKENAMFLKQKSSGHLVEVLSLNDLFNPKHANLVGRLHYGEEMQDPEKFAKADLAFPSGEELPRCWLDVHYRDQEVAHK
jgi:hypothetical protein